MHFFPATKMLLAVSSILMSLGLVSADRIFQSSSLDSCQDNSAFTASLFNILFAPDNRTLSLNVIGESSVTGNVSFTLHVAVYGYNIITQKINPCTLNLPALCPLASIATDFDTTYTNVSASIIGNIPGVAYQIPDLDAVVTVYMYSVDDPTTSLACLRANISNGKTVNQVGVKWATAIIAIIGLIASGIVSSLGFANTAAHMMVYTLCLFSYFQSVAIIGLCAVKLPPIVLSWTQDLSWSVGVINVNFLQKMARWYQIATGGTPSTVLTTLASKSVQVAKRGIDSRLLSTAATTAHTLLRRSPDNRIVKTAAHALARRGTSTTATGDYIVTGIQRLAFIEGMESTNLFMTAVAFYFIFVLFGVILVLIYKGACEIGIRRGWIGPETHLFHFIHNGWAIRLKGITFRLILIGYLPILILSFWEFTVNDSGAEIFLAVVFFLGMTSALTYASFKVFRIAKRSEQMYKTAAYSLYADATVLNKWGFLYVPYKASCYTYVLPMLAYTIIKAAFVGFGQKSGETQAIALVMIEAFALIGASVVRPWMDKSTNVINISICSINFFNAILLLIFTNVFDGPGLLIGVLGVVFFIANVVFAFVLLIMVLVVVTFSFLKKNPETQYEAVADNRASFIKSQTTLNQELDALGATARGGGNFSSEKFEHHRMNSINSTLSQNRERHTYSNMGYHEPVSAFPPAGFKDDDLPSSRSSNLHPSDPYRNSDGVSISSRSGVEAPFGLSGGHNSPLRTGSPGLPVRTASPALSARGSNNNMWQRGAGYN